MVAMIDATNTIESTRTELLPELAESNDELGEAITSLWAAHLNAKCAARATREELLGIRTKLGEQLHKLKQLLAQPGRGGQWSAFLRERQIPRATADRLVSCHLRLLNPNANRPSEANSEPTEEEVQKLFASVWPKLRHTLSTPTSVYTFVAMLTSSCECGIITDHGILVLKPTAPAICPASPDADFVVDPEL
jgi:hypothetical protein